MVTLNQIIKNRFLPERSFLYFSYPSKESNNYDFHLPLLENVEISESQKPNIATYDLVGRPGNLFAYLGAKSREFTLKFNITLPNLIDYMNNIGLSRIFEKGLFDIIPKKTDVGWIPVKPARDESGKFIRARRVVESEVLDDLGKKDRYKHFYNEWYYLKYETMDSGNELAELTNKFEALTTSVKRGFVDRKKLDELSPQGLLDYFDVKNPGEKIRTISNVINYLLMMINVIRTSTINKGSDTSLGPPAIYINHGSMYNNIPCLCTNYSIRLGNVGYEIVSMTPRQIEITLTLVENRTGNFGKFTPFKPIEGENLAGWESIILENSTLDPSNNKYRDEHRRYGQHMVEATASG